jgi:uncharacterized protein YjiS (DUF1127 family)
MSEHVRTGFATAFAATRQSRRADLFGAVRRALRAMTTRRELASLEPRLLEDIGLSRAEAVAEAARVPWDFAAPSRCRPTHGLWHAVGEAIRRRRERALLSRLDARALHDLGVGFGEIETEANKPFWRP